jgi:hypothetical protein
MAIELREEIKAALLTTVPALGSRESGRLDWKNGEMEEIADRQAKLLIEKCDYITVRNHHSVGEKTIMIRFEKIVLRGTKKNRFWDIYLIFDKASSRYPQLTFLTLRPQYHHMDDKDDKKFKIRNFVSGLHPHISNRSGCFGEFEKPLMALLSSFNYTGAIMIVRKFLDTWNRDSAYWDMNTMNSTRWMYIRTVENREMFRKLSFAERVFLKRDVYDSTANTSMRDFENLVTFVAKMKINCKAGIDWSCLMHFYSLINYVDDFSNKYIKNHEDLRHINTLFNEPRRLNFIWYEVSADVMIRKRIIWFDCRIEDFKSRLKQILLNELTPSMLTDYSILYTEFNTQDERDKFTEKMMSKLTVYSDVRYKRVMSEYIKSQIKMTKLPLELKDIWCNEENVDNIFNIDFLSQLMDEARLQCCVIALKRIRTKERKLRNEIATLRGDALQAELFSEEVPGQGVERPSVVQPES